MLETLLALAAVAAKFAYDHFSSVRQKADDIVRAAARAVMPTVIEYIGDDKVRAHQMFRLVLSQALELVRVTPTDARLELADAIFGQLWDAHARGKLTDGLAQLATAGAKAARIADWLASPASDPFAALRSTPMASAVDGLVAQAAAARARGTR